MVAGGLLAGRGSGQWLFTTWPGIVSILSGGTDTGSADISLGPKFLALFLTLSLPGPQAAPAGWL